MFKKNKNFDVDKLFKELNERLEKNEGITKELVSNDHYINALEKFTDRYDYFTNGPLFSYFKDFDADEIIDNLGFFFDGIENYTLKNFIFPINIEVGYYYKIKNENAYYYIGYINGYGGHHFCRRLKDGDDSFLDFQYIKRNIDLVTDYSKIDLSSSYEEPLKKLIKVKINI